MTSKPINVLGALLLLSCTSISNAASIILIPESPTTGLQPGDEVSFRIDIDFFNVGGTVAGGFDVMWDPNAIALISFTDTVILGDPAIGLPPEPDPGNGKLMRWVVGDFTGLNTGTVGQVSFEVLSGGPLSSFVMLLPNATAQWVSAVDFVTILDPDYNQVKVSRVPLPAAVWFTLSGLGVLIGIGRSAA